MRAYVFPGQGAQFVGMGQQLYTENAEAKKLFDKANEILGFAISEVMFHGTEDELKQTKVTQPAVFLHSVLLAKSLHNEFKPDMVRVTHWENSLPWLLQEPYRLKTV